VKKNLEENKFSLGRASVSRLVLRGRFARRDLMILGAFRKKERNLMEREDLM